MPLPTEPCHILRLVRRKDSGAEVIHSNYRFVIGFNGALIALGVAGVLPPATSATLHNLSTLGVSLRSMSALPLSKKNTP